MKTIKIALLSILSSTFCFSQDTITKRSGEDIVAKVVKVGQTEIEYKKFDNLEGPLFTILKSDVLMIRYENGSKDIFDDQPVADQSVASTFTPPHNMFIKGQSDALTFYDGYKAAGTGTLITGLLSPLAGLIPAIACSSTKPSASNLNYPDGELMKLPEYSRGYTTRAKKIKQGKVWKNWGIALGVNLVAIVLLTSN